MTRTEARKIAQQALRLGFHNPTICEDIEHKQIYVQMFNRCWVARNVHFVCDWDSIKDEERR
jgi:hypothetical protein